MRAAIVERNRISVANVGKDSVNQVALDYTLEFTLATNPSVVHSVVRGLHSLHL